MYWNSFSFCYQSGLQKTLKKLKSWSRKYRINIYNCTLRVITVVAVAMLYMYVAAPLQRPCNLSRSTFNRWRQVRVQLRRGGGAGGHLDLACETKTSSRPHWKTTPTNQGSAYVLLEVLPLKGAPAHVPNALPACAAVTALLFIAGKRADGFRQRPQIQADKNKSVIWVLTASWEACR